MQTSTQRLRPVPVEQRASAPPEGNAPRPAATAPVLHDAVRRQPGDGQIAAVRRVVPARHHPGRHISRSTVQPDKAYGHTTNRKTS